jgi:dipeptidyl aminopeptidase/acylaminoacyl peptidase
MDVKTEAFGSWVSPIAAQDLAAGAVKFEQLALDGDNILWVESRPDEKGRSVVVRMGEDGPEDVTPQGFCARTLVNSYGGGAMAAKDGTVWFTNFATSDFPQTKDQRIYRQAVGQFPKPITPRQPVHFADMEPDAARGLIFAVQERSDVLLNGQAQQTMVAMDMAGDALPITIAMGGDFYASPRLSPDGSQLAWLTWDYPSMPWEGTRLQVASLDAQGNATDIKTIGGKPATQIDPDLNPVLQNAMRYSDEAMAEPLWSPDGQLYCVSDRNEINGTRWWNICRIQGDDLVAVTQQEAEFTAPLWRLGVSSYGFITNTQILAAYTSGGLWRLARVDVTTGYERDVDLPYTSITHLRVGKGFAVFFGGQFQGPSELVRLDLETFEVTVLRSANPGLSDAARACLKPPQAISFPVDDSNGGTEPSHAFYHAPCNPDYQGPGDELPPLIIVIHGGPSASASSALSLDIAFFTSRGFAVLDTNYRGSTGFGRSYRQRIYGGWGDVDVADCAAGAQYLIDQDKVDRKRIASRGGSSGGYTTLALATFTDILSAGATYYGISDLQMIAQDTDKLEAFYAALLVGPWPEAKKLFKARSPLFHADKITCPLIIFQGKDDPVVPPPQAQVLIDSLMDRKMPVAWEFFEREGHGFRQKAHIIQALEEELSFYGTIMGFSPAGHPAQPKIRNWPA